MKQSKLVRATRSVSVSFSMTCMIWGCGNAANEASSITEGILPCAQTQVPAMTSSTAPSGQVTSSGEYDSSYGAWQAFDASLSTLWISETYETPAWIAYQWADGAKLVERYALTFKNGASLATRAPKDFTLQGWDGSAWVVLDTRHNETNWAGSERREYAVANPGSYVQYRLNFTDDNDDREGVVVISLGHIELIGTECSAENGGAGGATSEGGAACESVAVPAMTSATAPSGQVLRSGVYDSSYEAWQAFDASPSTLWISKTWETPAWIAYGWADGAKVVEHYALTFKNGAELSTRAPKDFTLQGWDGSAWVVVDARRGETNWAGSERRVYRVVHPGSYQQYRLNVTDDNDDRDGVVVISLGRIELMGDGCDSAGGPSTQPPSASGTAGGGSGGTSATAGGATNSLGRKRSSKACSVNSIGAPSNSGLTWLFAALSSSIVLQRRIARRRVCRKAR